MVFCVPILKEYGFLKDLDFKLVSVGSRKIEEADDWGNQDWKLLAPNLTIYGIDADADACEAANAELAHRNINWQEHHFSLALADSNAEKTLYVTKNPMCTSLYEPNEKFIRRFAQLADLAGLDFTVEIETTTLDDFCGEENIETIDFLHMDVQGAELQVLRGASKSLSQGILAIKTEVSFSRIYNDQPLFTDVDLFLREQGYSLFDYEIAKSRGVRKHSPVYSLNRIGQLLWGDAYYFCDLLEENVLPSLKSPKNMLKLVCIADILDFPDYSLELLEYLTIHYGDDDPQYNFADCIVQCLAAFSDVLPDNLAELDIIQKVKPYTSRGCLNRFKI